VECFDLIFIDGLLEAHHVDGKGRERGEGEQLGGTEGEGDRDMQIGLTLLRMCEYIAFLCVCLCLYLCVRVCVCVRARASERIVYVQVDRNIPNKLALLGERI
jgi:hypothetical protein